MINICTLSDNNYAQHLGVMIASVLINSKKEDKIAIHVLDGGISEKNKKRLERLKSIKNFSINYHKVNDEDLKECKSSYLPLVSYYNFLPQKYLPNLNKIVFLDSDMVILDSLSELFSIDIGNNVIAACEDPVGRINMKRLGISDDYFYFNTGTMIMNLKLWREQDIFSQLIQYVKDYQDKILYMDQDVLNDVLHTKSFKLPLKWNSIHFTDGHTYKDINEYEEALNNPAIIHYAMKDKPWRLYSRVYRKKIYWDTLKKTPWYNYKFLVSWFILSNLKICKKSIRKFLKFRFVIKPIEQYFKNR